MSIKPTHDEVAEARNTLLEKLSTSSKTPLSPAEVMALFTLIGATDQSISGKHDCYIEARMAHRRVAGGTREEMEALWKHGIGERPPWFGERMVLADGTIVKENEIGDFEVTFIGTEKS